MFLKRIKSPLKELFLIFFLAAFGFAMHLGVWADTEATVNATVTAQQVAVSVDPGTISYGTLDTGSTASTALGDADSVDATQDVSNDGNVNEDFDLKGTTSAAWALSDTAGSDTYTHEYCDTDCDGSPTWYDLGTGYTSAASSIGSGNTWSVDFKISLPTATTATESQDVDVFVMCSSS
jgi:hypothetical protein